MKRTEKEQIEKEPINKNKIKKITFGTVGAIIIASASFTLGYMQPQTTGPNHFSTNATQTSQERAKLSKAQDELTSAKRELEEIKTDQLKVTEERRAAESTRNNLNAEIAQKQKSRDNLNEQITSLQESKKQMDAEALTATSDNARNAQKVASEQDTTTKVANYFNQAINSYHDLDNVDKGALAQFGAYNGPAWTLMNHLIETKADNFDTIKDEFVKSEFAFGSTDNQRESAAHALYQTVDAQKLDRLD